MACLASKTVKRDADYADQTLKNADKDFGGGFGEKKTAFVSARQPACVSVQLSIY
jgi:hypothetical protein